MKRRLPNLLAVGSFVFFLLALTLWVESFWEIDVVKGYPYLPYRFLISAHGQFILHGNEGFKWAGVRSDPSDTCTIWSPSRGEPGLKWSFAYAGFSAASTVGAVVAGPTTYFASGGTYSATFYPAQWEVRVPDLAVALGTAIWPAIAIRRMLRGRPTCGLCPNCGYDPRATPERCPECGTVSAVKATPSSS